MKQSTHRERTNRAKQAKRRLEKMRKRYRKRSRDFMQSDRWHALRHIVLDVYGRRCMRCGHTGSQDNWIEVDHILSRSRHPRLALSFGNLQVLCHTCNTDKDQKKTDYRPDPLPTAAVGLIILDNTGGIEVVLESRIKQSDGRYFTPAMDDVS